MRFISEIPVKLISTLIFIAVVLVGITDIRGGQPSYKVYKNSAAGTVHYSMLEGLKLINKGDYDKWVMNYCSTTKLCYNSNSIKQVKKYNLPAMKKLAPECIKESGTAIYVTRTEGNPLKDKEVRIFILCKPNAMPKPVKMINENGWKFSSI